MALQPFTNNFEDHSTDAGFQFTFFCDICKEGYKTSFITAKSYKKKGFFKGLGAAASIGGGFAGVGGSKMGRSTSRGTDVMAGRYQGKPPAWHKEHEKAFELAQNEGKGNFHRCPRCRKYVCENDWNEQQGLCTNDAPRVAVEVAAARADKMREDIREKASRTQVFTGKIESKQTMCPKCGKPSGEGKFCNNCGTPLGLMKCPKCGAENQAGIRFCGGCGTKLA